MHEFINAKPVWLKNMREAKNLQVGFRCDFDAECGKKYVLRLAGSTYFKVYINGEFAAYGPARPPHGYVRADEITLNVKNGKNRLAVEVAGYNCSSFYSLPIKSFLMAELFEDGVSLKHSGKDFSALSLENLRTMYSYRYSYQRTYSEIWNFDQNDELYFWKISDVLNFGKLYTFDLTEDITERGVIYPDYKIVGAESVFETGKITHKEASLLDDIRYVARVSNEIDGFPRFKIKQSPVEELYGDFIPYNETVSVDDEIVLDEGEYVIYKMPFNNTGFIKNKITALKDCEVHVFYAEYNYENGMIFGSFSAYLNDIKYNLKKSGEPYDLESFEPYTCQYIGIAVTKGRASVVSPKIREYCYSNCENTEFSSSDEDINKIFAAAVETYRQNTLDVYMDCPGRERGGWLCDSYFTANSEKTFSGTSDVEKVYLENFILAKEFPNLPAGMIPMVYPSDIKPYNSGYIPQWALWYVIELGDFVKRRTDTDVSKYRTLCYDLFEWFGKYENSDGLLEKLPGWNLIEWSQASDWIDDVNYPTNMLYSLSLRIAGDLFGDPSLFEKAENIKNKILEQSFDGEFFVDNALRNESGELIVTKNRSEICQYFAYFCKILNPNDKKFEKLIGTIVNVFGADREKKKIMPEIVYAQPFIGYYVRMVVLLDLQKYDNVISDIKGYFLNMANTTGTLWEFDSVEKARGSLNHGFASFAGVALIYALAGISAIKYDEKKLLIDRSYLADADFRLKIAVDGGFIEVVKKGQEKKISVPDGWETV